MEILDQLGVALGLASLAGLNLYLTVMLAGAAIRFGWIELAAAHSELAVLAEPWILVTAGVLFLIEFFADKIPWIDSLWDTAHTVIRPVGGTLLALAALGEMDPTLGVVLALLCGGATLSTHLGKAGTRLASNLNPEPTTNVGSSVTASLAEDGIVIGGLALTAFAPWLALIVFLIFVTGAVVVARKSFGLFGKLWQKLRRRAS